jgi:hypothetical protein
VCKKKEVERSLVSRAIFLPAPECCLLLFFFSVLHGFQKHYLQYRIWQQACVGGFRKHQDAKEIKGEADRDVCMYVSSVPVWVRSENKL